MPSLVTGKRSDTSNQTILPMHAAIQVLDINSDMPKICLSIKDRSVPLDEGFKMIINNFAGIN